MGGSSIFVKYGLKSGGGPSFLRRTRTVFGQLQTRVRSGSTFEACNWQYHNTVLGHYGYTDDTFKPAACTQNDLNFVYGCVSWPNGKKVICQVNLINCDTSRCYYNNAVYRTNKFIACNFGAFSDWTNTSSCDPTSTCASNGNRQCQTIYSFREQDWSSYEEVDVCVVASPIAALNAVQVECIEN
jgi:hypothetical protein